MAVTVAVVGIPGCGDGHEPASRLDVEIAGSDLIVYVSDLEANVPAIAGGAKEVELVCRDDRGVVVLRRVEPWPFTDTDDGSLAPHVHERLGAARSSDIAQCSLEGTAGPLQGAPSLAG